MMRLSPAGLVVVVVVLLAQASAQQNISGSSNLTNTTSTVVSNTSSVPSSSLNRSALTPPNQNQSSGAFPVPMNVSSDRIVIRNQTVPVVMFNQTMARPLAVAGSNLSVITPPMAQQQLAGQAPSSSTFNPNEIVAVAGWNGSIVDNGETLILKLPRSSSIDLRVQDVFLPGVGSQAAFRPLSDGTADIMVELLLLEDEVNDVLRSSLSAGFHAMALHTHFLFDQPKAYFLHLHGAGLAPRPAAAALRNLTSTIADVRAAPPPPTAETAPVTAPSTVSLESRPGSTLRTNSDDGTVDLLAAPWTSSIMGFNASHALGCQSHATFAGTNDDDAVFGQFCTAQYNLQRVLVVTLQQGLSITAIVNHFVGDVPPTIFVHFWGRGPARQLAHAVEQAFSEASRTP